MVIDMTLSSTTAAAVAAALVAGASVLAFSQIPGLFVWAAFIGWASYDHSGANRLALARSSAALVFGVVMAWSVAIVVASGVVPLTTPLATAVCAGLASFVIVMASRVRLLSVTPAVFYGFAATFAYFSLAPGAFTMSAMTEADLRNPCLLLSMSLLIGSGLGAVQGWLAKTLVGTQTKVASGQNRSLLHGVQRT